MPNNQTATNAPPRKPLTPALSSKFLNNRQTVAPRLAGSSRSSPFSTRHGGGTVSTTSPTVLPKDAGANAISPPNGTNITPRSGVRRTKLEGSPVTTGNAQIGVLPKSRPVSAIEGGQLGASAPQGTTASGLGISDSESLTSLPSRPMSMVVGDSASPSIRRASIGKPLLNTTDSKFFHADDAQSCVSSQSVQEGPQLKAKGTAFFFANDATEFSRRPSSTTSTPSPILRKDGQNPAQRNTRNGAKLHDAATPPSMRDSARRSPSPITAARDPSLQRKGLHRPGSPLKAASFETMPAETDRPTSRPEKCISTPQQVHKSASTSSASYLRRTSVSSATSDPRPQGHRKTPSTGSSIGPRPSRQSSVSLKSSTPAAQPGGAAPRPLYVSSPETSPHSVSFGSSYGVHSIVSEHVRSPEMTPISPTKQGRSQALPGQTQGTSDLAANARRERKVLDLEISNSSLLAINRTLEKELRKQASELRRFRRLSRVGRLSTVSSSLRSISGQSAVNMGDDITEHRSEASDLSDITDLDNEEDDLESSFDGGEDDSTTSQDAQDVYRRARDEKRLLLDLSKHQQMLVDSQKVSQSIRRCLTWTDELITEGQKALEHQVRVSDVEIGGRVLMHEDDTDMGSGRALLSPAAEVEEANPFAK
ncbi:MAG: hypothetical protein Q9227_007233 [Pyrenula ochraceoflavens]